MARRKIEHDAARRELCVRFPYDERLLPIVRAFSGRRFDREERAWFCPEEAVVEVVDTLREHGFELDEPVWEVYRARGGQANGSGAPNVTRTPSPFEPPLLLVDSPASLLDSWTVGQLNRKVKEILRAGLPSTVWLIGEITGFERNRHRRTVHFELAEKDSAEENADLRATVSAVLFERTRLTLEKRLAAAEEPFELRDGIEVRVAVRVDLYEARGNFQVVIEDIDPIHTLGKIAQNRAKILAELDRRGLREKNLSLPWPRVPLRIGLLTSVGSDAYNDFVNELQRSGYAFLLTAADVRMQGPQLRPAVRAALQWFGARSADFDVLALVRGGGARTDLMWFDDLEVALAVAECPIKVVAGIGHHRDVSVVDLLVAREKTPTAAAACIVQVVRSAEEGLFDQGQRLLDRSRRRLSLAARDLDVAAAELLGSSRTGLRTAVRRAEGWSRTFSTSVASCVHRLRRPLATTRQQLTTLCRTHLHRLERRNEDRAARLQVGAHGSLRATTRSMVERRRRLSLPVLRARLEPRSVLLCALLQRARALHPRAVLARGFAIVRNTEGKVVRDASKLALGSELSATLAQGEVVARVERVAPAQSEERS